ncbi:MAG: AtpZ/AtpI family protein [Burkholderiaceae bacterium]
MSRRGPGANSRLVGKEHRVSGSALGTMGLVGWSVAVPTLLGSALGLWLDARYPGERSWTLALLVAGLVLGCINAWHWLVREGRAIQENEKENDDADV